MLLDNRLYWFNFKTGEYDYIERPSENWLDYLPQDPAAQGLFKCHVAMGKSEAEAMIEILTAVLPEKYRPKGE